MAGAGHRFADVCAGLRMIYRNQAQLNAAFTDLNSQNLTKPESILPIDVPSAYDIFHLQLIPRMQRLVYYHVVLEFILDNIMSKQKIIVSDDNRYLRVKFMLILFKAEFDLAF